jgi:protein TonB
MFGEVVRRSVRLGSGAWYTVPLSILAHVTLAAVVVVVPLMATDVLPKPTSFHPAFVHTPPPPPPPPVAAAPPSKTTTAPPDPTIAPTEPSPQIVAEPAAPPAPNTGPGVEGGLPEGLAGSTSIGTMPIAVPVPPPAPALPKLHRVGGDIAVPKKIKDVRPVYPALALTSRISGTVVIEATIGADGRVQNARVIESIALLDQAALNAVRQWQFTPTRLNGVPIPVIMTVTIDFLLQ